LLSLQFDEVCLLSRTPSYAAATRTDFLLMAPNGGRTTALTLKWATGVAESELTQQWDEDVTYHEGQRHCGTLVGFIYDPEGRLPDPDSLETAWSRPRGDIELRCVVAR